MFDRQCSTVVNRATFYISFHIFQAFYDLSALQCNGDLHDMDAKKLKTDCSLEELRESIIQTKLELIRACAVVAEARSQPLFVFMNVFFCCNLVTLKPITVVNQSAYSKGSKD